MRLWRRTECWLDSGLVTVIGRPAALCSGSPASSSVVVGREALDELRRDQGEGHDLGQAGAGERLADEVAHLERIVAVRRHRRVREASPGRGRSRGRG